MSTSTETRDERFGAVSRIVEAARAIASDRAIVDALVSSTGLSWQGVALALSDCLETNPTNEEVYALVDGAKRTHHVHVILSANVFTGALRAIACARAAASTVSVQLSSREPVFARRLIETIADPAIFVAEQRALENLGEGEIHVYGRAATIESVRTRAKSGVLVRGHGPGIGIAVVPKKDSLGDAADAIARDVVPFDQRGCLSPRVVVVIGDAARAEDLSARLGAALATVGEMVPRGALTSDEAAEAARYLETMRFAGAATVGRGYLVGVSSTIHVPPAGRHVHVAHIPSPADLPRLLEPVSAFVTAVGSSDLTIRSFFSPFVRFSKLGEMQKPPFDGPVDLRPLV